MPDHPRIFVSHSQHDDEWCRAFVGALRAAGWDVWYDATRPDGAEPVPHLTPSSLSTLGFRGCVVDGVGCVLPPLCPVPAGTVPMGSDKTRDAYARHNEMPQYPVQVGDFAIGQHPVTVAEYACAVRAGSVREPPRVHSGVDWPWPQQLQHPDHPVVCVDWEDALAYVRWLAVVTGQPWRLPTEAEWERAARGPDGRIYPWGDAFDTTRCSTNASGIGTTSPVGSYPDGASPYGAQDMAGNVWEWTCSHYKPYAYDHQYGTEDLDTPGNRVLRGGSWADESVSARVACRSYVMPGIIRHTYGFRVVLSAVAGS